MIDDLEDAAALTGIVTLGGLLAIAAWQWVGPYVPTPPPVVGAPAAARGLGSIQGPIYANAGTQSGPVLKLLA